MIEARNKRDGRLIAWQLANILGPIAGFLGSQVDAESLNPFGGSPGRSKSEERREVENRLGWGLLRRAWAPDLTDENLAAAKEAVLRAAGKGGN
jgi:hypothetical protein